MYIALVTDDNHKNRSLKYRAFFATRAVSVEICVIVLKVYIDFSCPAARELTMEMDRKVRKYQLFFSYL
jgi:hypothetical protein